MQRLLNCYPGQPDEEAQHEHHAEQRISFWENLMPCLVWNAQSLSSINAYIAKHRLLPSIAYAHDISDHVAHTKKKTLIHSVEKEINSSVNITMRRYIHFMESEEMQRMSNDEFSAILFGADVKDKVAFINLIEQKWPQLHSSQYANLRNMLGKVIRKTWPITLKRLISNPSVIDGMIERGVLNIDAVFVDPKINIKLQINFLRECLEQGIIDSSIITSNSQVSLVRVFEDETVKSVLEKTPGDALKKLYLRQSLEYCQNTKPGIENTLPSEPADGELLYSREKRRSSYLGFDEEDAKKVVQSEASAAAAACVMPMSSMGDSPSKSRRITPSSTPPTTPQRKESLSLMGFYSPLKAAVDDSPSKKRKTTPHSTPPRPVLPRPLFWDVSVVAQSNPVEYIKP